MGIQSRPFIKFEHMHVHTFAKSFMFIITFAYKRYLANTERIYHRQFLYVVTETAYIGMAIWTQ